MSADPIVGGDLLRLVTAGMYSNPLILYREYIQNAADAIASRGKGSVRIKIDRFQSRVTILDDGTGLSPQEAAHRLIDVGHSKKDHSVDRGFRGIGRLSGLAFADQIQFTTRTGSKEPVTQVTWNGRALRDAALAKSDVATAIEQSTTICQVPESDWPDRFFEVTVDRINRHAASALLNDDAVRSYIGEVCPVPMASSFPLAGEIYQFLNTHTDHMVLDVRVNDESRPVTRPFADTIQLSDRYGAVFDRLETRVIPAIDGDDPAAIVWLAHTPYAGSIPRRLGVRGLRARIGNIQIGTDKIFEHLFLEPRFNGWCVGEVHILDKRVFPNGQRDYFEPSPQQRNLENHIGAIAHEISARCRKASSQRNKLRKLGTAINQLKRACDLAVSGYLRAADASALVERERKRIPEIKQTLAKLRAITSNSDQRDLAYIDQRLDAIDVNRKPALNGVPPNSIDTVQAVFGAITETVPPDSAIDMIETILRRLSDQSHDRVRQVL